MNLGPLHFSNEISLGTVIQVITILFLFFKYIKKYLTGIKKSHERTDQLWTKFNGKYEGDPEGWFSKLAVMDEKVNQMWTRLSFNRLTIDEIKSRSTDGTH